MALARTIRYGLEALLAARYGEAALDMMKDNYATVAVVSIAIIVGSVLLARRFRPTDEEEPASPAPEEPQETP